MMRVGLTGGIGTGKSLVADIFINLGIPVFFADTEAKSAYKDANVLEQIRNIFGNEPFDENRVNFIKLAQIVFSSKPSLEKLNQIIHPYVMRKFEDWQRENIHADYVIMESAILYETGFDEDFDKMIVVSAPMATCMQRVISRDGISREQVLKRMENQLPDDFKCKNADYIIQNDGDTLVAPQVIAIHDSLLDFIKK
jgi:dephospho-CoA kinase